MELMIGGGGMRNLPTTMPSDFEQFWHETLSNAAQVPMTPLLRHIEQESNEFHDTVIGTKTFTVDLAPGESKTLLLGVEWGYGGTYSGIQLDSIECGGNITLSR